MNLKHSPHINLVHSLFWATSPLKGRRYSQSSKLTNMLRILSLNSDFHTCGAEKEAKEPLKPPMGVLNKHTRFSLVSNYDQETLHSRQ